jgi:class I fructose-bisphosphate aldolase
VLPAQPRLQNQEADYHVVANLTGQANHIGVTLETDIINQKMIDNKSG